MVDRPVTFSPTELHAWLARIIGERHIKTSPEHHRATADLIGDTFQNDGFEVREQPVSGPDGLGCNVIGTRAGWKRPERSWIVGAHYDTVIGTPGADDNGIAVAGLLEASRLLSRFRFQETLQLVAWDLEELQGLLGGITLGSRTMAREAKCEGGQIAGVFDLEMIGRARREPRTQSFPIGFGALFPGFVRWAKERQLRGDFIAVVANPRSESIARALEDNARIVDLPIVSILVRGPARLLPDFYRSDHAPFWRHDYPAVMLTDTANFRSQDYHRPTDTIDKIDFDFAARVMEATIGAAVHLAGGVET